MTSTTPTTTEQKLTRIYSEHRRKEILYRIQYELRQSGDCKIYTIESLDELE